MPIQALKHKQQPAEQPDEQPAEEADQPEQQSDEESAGESEQPTEQSDENPDEAWRARAEADFLTSRALKLAPDSEEVKKLRDEVVRLLGLKTS